MMNEIAFWALSFAALLEARTLPHSMHSSIGPVSLLQSRADGNSAAFNPSSPRPALGSVPYGAEIWHCSVPGTVAMTFDDGPSDLTPMLLDTLKAAQVKATFFVVGNNNGRGDIDDPSKPWGDVIRRAYSEGHQIGSHTWTHPRMNDITSAQRISEMNRNEQALTKILGFYPSYMRPPYGFCAAETGCRADMGKLGYHIVDFDLDTNDWQNQGPDLIQKSKDTVAGAVGNANPQAQSFLMLEHDTHEWTVKSLVPFNIDFIRSKGFRFVTVGECLNDPPENWYRNPATGNAAAHNVQPQAQLQPSSSTTTVVTTPSPTPVPTTVPTTTTHVPTTTVAPSSTITTTTTTTSTTTVNTAPSNVLKTTTSTATTKVQAASSSSTTATSRSTTSPTQSPTALVPPNSSFRTTVNARLVAILALVLCCAWL